MTILWKVFILFDIVPVKPRHFYVPAARGTYIVIQLIEAFTMRYRLGVTGRVRTVKFWEHGCSIYSCPLGKPNTIALLSQ